MRAQELDARARGQKEQILQTGLGQLGAFAQTQYTDKLKFNALDELLTKYSYDTKSGKFKLKSNKKRKGKK